ncbi:XF1762 family protein [Nonomuraea angiospora]|uniref:L-amino acid N-acyltransferase YncA n=1 Tax=Nonomuraea angiospora TaxID=46172 RepID=A0ABR9LWA9_9ACTN|nr:XF1762 family protein [Nonomuraea angiospora]MBE1584548.1 L-amino acid N-acyltransferase YncA [Nonomuraea angiospora]
MENHNEIRANAHDGGPAILLRQPNQRLTVTPVAIQTARAFTAWTDRHLAPQAEIVLGVQTDDGTLVGVVFVDGWSSDDEVTAEIVCLSTDGTPNACSALLGAARRAARAAGYRRLIACIRPDERSTSLRAAGFRPAGDSCIVWEASTAGGGR